MWKDIKGWEPYYEIEDTGVVRNKQTGGFIVGDINSAGYYRVALYRKGHIPPKKRYFRHRLVAEHYLPNPHGFDEVNHKDCDKSNNKATNLEWITRKDNELHSRIVGHKKYKPYEVTYFDGRALEYNTTPELALQIGVTRRTVANWLAKRSKGYRNYGIKTINYI